MINKSIFSILMAVSFFVNSLRAMENPSRDRNLEQSIQKKDSKENESSKTTACSLKDIIVKRVGLKALCILSPKIFPEELREYGIKFLINEHCVPLEKFKEKEYAYVLTEEDLNNYKQVLYELCEKQIEGIDVAMAEFGKCWPGFCYMSLYDIGEFLRILTKQSNGLDILSAHELIYRDKGLDYILSTKNVELFKLLLNKGLLPRLDYKVNINDNYVCSFFKRLIICKSSYFFETILQKEKDKDYDWKQLLDQEEGCISGDIVQILNAIELAKNCFKLDIFKAILNLAQQKGLLDINVQKVYEDGQTLLMYATQKGKVELVKFLLENGADINIKSNNGKTVLDYAKDTLAEIEAMLGRKIFTDIHEWCENRKQQIMKCISLLEQAKAEQGASTLIVPDLVPDNKNL